VVPEESLIGKKDMTFDVFLYLEVRLKSYKGNEMKRHVICNHRSGSSQPAKMTLAPTSAAVKAPHVWVRFGKGAGDQS